MTYHRLKNNEYIFIFWKLFFYFFEKRGTFIWKNISIHYKFALKIHWHTFYFKNVGFIFSHIIANIFLKYFYKLFYKIQIIAYQSLYSILFKRSNSHFNFQSFLLKLKRIFCSTVNLHWNFYMSFFLYFI